MTAQSEVQANIAPLRLGTLAVQVGHLWNVQQRFPSLPIDERLEIDKAVGQSRQRPIQIGRLLMLDQFLHAVEEQARILRFNLFDYRKRRFLKMGGQAQPHGDLVQSRVDFSLGNVGPTMHRQATQQLSRVGDVRNEC